MSERASHLWELAEGQISELLALTSTAGETVLHRPCPGREKLGDGSVGAVSLHVAGTYHRIASVARGSRDRAHDHADPHDHRPPTETITAQQLLQELSGAQHAHGLLADLTDEQLDTVPPAGSARFCDGQRNLEQVITSMLKHQRHQVDAVKAAVHERTA